MQDSRFKQPLALILLSRISISRVLHLPMPKGLLCETIGNCNSLIVETYIPLHPFCTWMQRGVFRFQPTSVERYLMHRLLLILPALNGATPTVG